MSYRTEKERVMQFEMRIQEAGATTVLYDTLVEQASNANKVISAYAFISAAGLELLFESNEIRNLLTNGNMKLIVGLDAITDTNSITVMHRYLDKYKGLEVLAYLSEGSGIFHPKFSCFSNNSKQSSTLVLGSGNLTLAGLRVNTEAYCIAYLSVDEAKNLLDTWEKWLENNRERLYVISDSKVIEAASRNKEIRKLLSTSIRKRKSVLKTKAVTSDLIVSEKDMVDLIAEESFKGGDWSFGEHYQVLLAEIPKSGNRWKQVNFDKNSFETFFGVSTTTSSSFVILRAVNQEGKLQPIERRPNVAVASQNYRFELSAAVGEYPINGRPVGIFVKLGGDTFLYQLLLPNHMKYGDVIKFVNEKREKPNRILSRFVITAEELAKKLPGLQILKYYV